MNFLVETKIEYTTQLVNILSPYIYEGIQSIYNDAKKISKKNEELKLFQTFLRKIPKWNQSIINNETKRILKESTCGDILEDLIKAVIKANIMLLTNTPPEKKNKLKINYMIELPVFIHNIYIESARNIFQNPFLFYHDYTSFELKKNQRDATTLIKTSINEAIRKMLPLNLILKEYLGNSFTELDNVKEEIDKHISENQKSKLIHMLRNENDNENYSLSKPKIIIGDYSDKKNFDDTSAALNEPPTDIKESYSNISKKAVDSIFKTGNQLSHISRNSEKKHSPIVTFNNETEKSITYNASLGMVKI